MRGGSYEATIQVPFTKISVYAQVREFRALLFSVGTPKDEDKDVQSVSYWVGFSIESKIMSFIFRCSFKI